MLFRMSWRVIGEDLPTAGEPSERCFRLFSFADVPDDSHSVPCPADDHGEMVSSTGNSFPSLLRAVLSSGLPMGPAPVRAKLRTPSSAV